MKKTFLKFGSLLIVVVLLLSACGGTETATPSTETIEEEEVTEVVATEEEEPPSKVVMAYPILGDYPEDLQLVQDALNELPQIKAINVTVELMPIPIFQYGEQMNLILSGSEQVDLMTLFNPIQNYITMIQNGQLLDITDMLAEYGTAVTDQIGEDYLKAVLVDGRYYGVPTLHDLANAAAVTMRTDLVEKYDIDTSTILTFEDLTPIFQIIKDNEPDIAPFFPGGAGYTPLDSYAWATVDRLGDGNGVLLNFGEELTVENWYASDDYASMINMLHSWYEAGYILPDSATVAENTYEVVKSGRAFCVFTSYKPGQQAQDSRSSGMEMTTIGQCRLTL
jgi:putative aldouronate transport system substrate-binding protein